MGMVGCAVFIIGTGGCRVLRSACVAEVSSGRPLIVPPALKSLLISVMSSSRCEGKNGLSKPFAGCCLFPRRVPGASPGA